VAEVRNVVVIGAGTMGHGIVHVAAVAGFDVWLHDVAGELIERGIAAVCSNLDRGVEKGKLTAAERDVAFARIRPAPVLAPALAEADLVIEAVPESIDLKRALFAALDRDAPARAILASNTSSLPIARIAEATRHPERVIGMHFFNPVHLMPLLELVRAERTAQDTVDRALQIAERLGKQAIVVRDAPGFATSRLGLALGLEAMRMLEQGVASAQDIDRAMELGYRHPMGPLKLTDLVGLDVRLAIAEHLHRELGTDTFRPPEILRRMVAEGRLGKKSGRGFYDW